MQANEASQLLSDKNIEVSKNIENLDMHFTLDSLTSLDATEDDHFWHTNRKRLLKKLVNELKIKRPFNGCDIGCGNGSILSFLQNEYPNSSFTGIDGYPQALINSRNRNSEVQLQLQDITALDKIEDEDKKYDIVFLMDVLEHLEHPEKTLDKIKGILKPNGHVIATVPACQSLWSDRDVFLGHYKRYSKNDFSELFSSNGYKVIKKNYFFSHLFLPTYITRLLLSKNKSGKEIESDELKIVPGVNGILKAVGNIENSLSLNMPLPFGTSVYCVARYE